MNSTAERSCECSCGCTQMAAVKGRSYRYCSSDRWWWRLLIKRTPWTWICLDCTPHLVSLEDTK